MDGVDDDLGLRDLVENKIAVRGRRHPANRRIARAASDVTRLGQPDGISPSRMAEMLEVDKTRPKVRCKIIVGRR